MSPFYYASLGFTSTTTIVARPWLECNFSCHEKFLGVPRYSTLSWVLLALGLPLHPTGYLQLCRLSNLLPVLQDTIRIRIQLPRLLNTAVVVLRIPKLSLLWNSIIMVQSHPPLLVVLMRRGLMSTYVILMRITLLLLQG